MVARVEGRRGPGDEHESLTMTMRCKWLDIYVIYTLYILDVLQVYVMHNHVILLCMVYKCRNHVPNFIDELCTGHVTIYHYIFLSYDRNIS